MQIKRRLQINVAVAVLVTVVMCLVLFLSLYRVNKANNLAKIADEIITQSFELVTLRNDYMRNESARAKEQWFDKQEQIGLLLKSASEKFRNADDKIIIAELIENHNSIGKIFSIIVAIREKSVLNSGPAELSRDAEDRLLNQLNMRVYEKVIHGRQLLESSRTARNTVLKQSAAGLFGMLALVIAAVVINSWSMGRTITARINRLGNGASKIGGGDLDHRIDIKGDDEFTELAGAFNAMTARLLGSYHALKNEIEERRLAERALEKAYDELELRVQERTKELWEVKESLELRVNERTAELQAINASLRDSRLATLNMMEDALAARKQAEETGEELRNEIEARIRTEKALRESEEFYRQTLESIPGMVFTTRPDGYCDYQSQQWVDFTGVPMKEHLGDGWNRLLHPDDRPRAYAAWYAAVEGRAPYDLEYRVRRHDGEYEWFKVHGRPIRDAAGNIVRWFGTAVNIDHLLKAQQALQASEAKYRTLFTNMTSGFALHKVILDSSNIPVDYIFWEVNKAFERLTGLQGDRIVGRRVTEVLPGIENDPADWIGTYGKVAQTREEIHFAQYSEGIGKWFSVSAFSPMQGFFVTIFEDITERKLAEQKLSNSLREKEVLLHEIHHRVKNNMQVISSLVNLQADTISEPSVRACLGDVRDRVRSMALVHEKLYQSGDFACLNFSEYADSLLQYLWQAHCPVAADIRLTMALQPVNLPVESAVNCGLILNELATNALKHAFRGRAVGEVTIGIGVDTATGNICLSVKDNGAGLPAGFDWQQTPSMGLRLVNMLAEQLNGRVELGTGPGTEFRLIFPAHTGEGPVL